MQGIRAGSILDENTEGIRKRSALNEFVEPRSKSSQIVSCHQAQVRLATLIFVDNVRAVASDQKDSFHRVSNFSLTLKRGRTEFVHARPDIGQLGRKREHDLDAVHEHRPDLVKQSAAVGMRLVGKYILALILLATGNPAGDLHGGQAD